jgi:hypothetical protein
MHTHAYVHACLVTSLVTVAGGIAPAGTGGLVPLDGAPAGVAIGWSWTPESGFEPPALVVPAEVTPAQMRRQLRRVTLPDGRNARTVADNWIAGSGNGDLQDEWEYGLTIRRDHPAIAALAAAYGLSAATVDGLFIAAAAGGLAVIDLTPA